MAKDVITRFKLETTQYDSKLKEEAKRLSDYSKTATQAKEGFNQFTKANVDAAKALGTMATSTTNAKERIKELVGAYNIAAKAYNSLTKEQQQGDWAQALAGSLRKLQQQIKDTKQEMQGLDSSMKNAGGGGLFAGLGGKMSGALQVFAGNMYTKAAEAVANLGSEMFATVKQGIELAKAGEGIRLAFNRLNDPALLDGLREATHGTVTDLELMKAAVRFNDFNLPLEELGTMLAFAQQKAKDTGQSVDYLVESIVNGLGRQSTMILDNLGLSQVEVKARTKETGDMTKAVGAIIREQMAKAGDYVETAADRAAQANVSLQNKMEELGRKFAPVEEASNQLWTSMKIGILDIIGGPLTTLLNGLTEAGRMRNALNNMGGNEQVNNQLGKLRVAKAAGSGYMTRSLYSEQVEQYNRQINAADTYLKQYDSNHSAVNTVLMAASKQFGQKFKGISELEAFKNAYVQMKNEYVKGAQEIMKASNTPATTTTADPKKPKGTKTELTELQQNQKKINDLTQEYIKLGDQSTEAAVKRQEEIQKEIQLLQQRNGLLGLRAEQAQGRMLLNAGDMDKIGLGNLMANPFAGDSKTMDIYGTLKLTLDDNAMKAVMEGVQKSLPKEKDLLGDSKKLVGGLSNIASGLQQMGVELPDGVQKVMGVIQGVMTVIEGVNAIISMTQTPAIVANTIALGTLTSAVATNTATNFIPFFAHGGVVHAANGFSGVVPGDHFSGDNVPALLNAGEVVLNRAQAGVLASALEGPGQRGGYTPSHVSGEQIWIALNAYTRRTGKGELVTWR